MPWWCRACAGRMGSPQCKKKCYKRWGEGWGAERIPPLDGFLLLETNPSISEEEDLRNRNNWFESKRKRERERVQ